MTSMTQRTSPDSLPTETVIFAHATTGYFKLGAYFPNRGAANDFIALFPKSVKAYHSISSRTIWDGDKVVGHEDIPLVGVHAVLAADGVNGGRNETGIRRVRRALKVLADNGYRFTWATPYSNSFPTFEAFEATI